MTSPKLPKIVLPSTSIFVGQTSAGKTTLLTRLVKEQILNKVDYVFIFARTMRLSGDYDFLPENEDIKKGPIVQHFIDDREFESILIEKVSEQEDIALRYGWEETAPALIIIEDQANMPFLDFKSFADRISVWVRKVNFTLIITTQRYCGVGCNLQINARYIWYFNPADFRELEVFCYKAFPPYLKNKIKKNIHKVFTKPYQFIFVDTFESRSGEKAFINGEENLEDFLRNIPDE